MNQPQNASFQAGQAKGQTQEKAGNLMDQASNAAQSAKESCQEAGQQVMAKAQGAADACQEHSWNQQVKQEKLAVFLVLLGFYEIFLFHKFLQIMILLIWLLTSLLMF
ncbi:stress-induced protein KIN2-like [Quillaja saponaria]|uniref:Stress-induced protein KIN2-like n=1 Tax=Quillaja saponaria TaxID=32244 RepID=A0AAD7VCA7_QUISA|nr:stress-induced protein KIN2-like [Quillaja saponaria]